MTRIHLSDDRLAHGIAKDIAAATADRLPRLKVALGKARSRDAFLNACAEHMRGRIIAADASRKAIGSRARAAVIWYEPLPSGDWGVFSARWEAAYPHLRINYLNITVERHAVARFFHRTAGQGDVVAALATFAAYLSPVLGVETTPGAQIRVTGPEGELRLLAGDNKHLTVKTWIADRTAVEITVTT